MPAPRMVIVAGPAGGGKSSFFPVKNLRGVDAWNNDDYRAQLNAARLGRVEPVYTDIPKEITSAAGSAMEKFIEDHIADRKSFAFETTLRRDITFEQAGKAAKNGFRVEMVFVAAGDVDEHLRRVMNRADAGGHSASEPTIREIYDGSMKNLVRAFRENQHGGSIEHLAVFHNTRADASTNLTPRDLVCLVEVVRGTPTLVAQEAPDWFHAAVRGTEFEFRRLHEHFRDDLGR
jgi:predicted ABC-type ATPase